MSKVDLFLATLPKEFLDLVTTAGKGGGLGFLRRQCRFSGFYWCIIERLAALFAECAVGRVPMLTLTANGFCL
jgi:hypothetical protein